ncbi:MAG: rod shape-determining protein MreC [Coprobacillaceae bacterium]
MNNHDKQRKKKRIILITTVTIILFSTVSLLIGRSNTRIETMLRDSVSLIEYYVIKKPISFVGDIINEYNALKDVYEENAILKEKLDNYANIESNNQVLTDELNRFKEAAEMDHLPTEYQVKLAYIITRPIDGWDQEVQISLGSTGGVEEGMAVMSSAGMIGIVTSTTELSATVSLLTNKNMVNSIPVQIHNGEQIVNGLLENYNAEDGTYEISLFSKIETLEKEALVTTSGLGGDDKAPKGLLIGKATEVGIKEDGINQRVYVKPAAQFDDLNYVSVVLQLGTNE